MTQTPLKTKRPDRSAYDDLVRRTRTEPMPAVVVDALRNACREDPR